MDQIRTNRLKFTLCLITIQFLVTSAYGSVLRKRSIHYYNNADGNLTDPNNKTVISSPNYSVCFFCFQSMSSNSHQKTSNKTAEEAMSFLFPSSPPFVALARVRNNLNQLVRGNGVSPTASRFAAASNLLSSAADLKATVVKFFANASNRVNETRQRTTQGLSSILARSGFPQRNSTSIVVSPLSHRFTNFLRNLSNSSTVPSLLLPH